MSEADCQCELLAKSAVGQIALCQACNQVHLTMHYLTVRLEPGAFQTLLQMMLQAQACLAATRKVALAPDTFLHH